MTCLQSWKHETYRAIDQETGEPQENNALKQTDRGRAWIFTRVQDARQRKRPLSRALQSENRPGPGLQLNADVLVPQNVLHHGSQSAFTSSDPKFLSGTVWLRQ